MGYMICVRYIGYMGCMGCMAYIGYMHVLDGVQTKMFSAPQGIDVEV